MLPGAQSGKIVVECTRAERPQRVRFVNGGPIEVCLDLELHPERASTRLVADFDARPRGLFRIIFPIFLFVMRRQEKKNLRNLKKALER